MRCSAPSRRADIFTLCVLLLCLILPTAAKNQDTATATSRYPNELPEFRFYESASWRSLVPFVSTMNDVRRVLGRPIEAHDVSEYTKPYPGDEKALEPVFTYELNGDWDLLVYFARYCFHSVPKSVPRDRLCSIDLLHRKPLAFDVSRLPKTFVKAHIQAVDAAWDEYSDGTGLRYEVYSTHTQYGSEKPGDLNRISYGPPNQEETDHLRLSTPVVRAWREIHVGSPVYALDDAVATKEWLGRALIQRIDTQTGKWHIWIEPGYSVFRIYPYLSEDSPQPHVYQGIVLKVRGTLSVDDLTVAIRSRASTVKIDEYDVFGTDSVSIQRYSRPHNQEAP